MSRYIGGKLGAYYLHTNGSLIWKPTLAYATDRHYFDSPFVRKVWYIPRSKPENQEKWVLDFLGEASKMGVKPSEIRRVRKAMLSGEYDET